MEIKTSKIKEVVKVSEPYGKFAVLYHKLVMENGDKIDIGKQQRQEIGNELSYRITGDIGQHEFTKAKSENPNWEGNKKSFSTNTYTKEPNRQLSIVKQSSLKAAVEFCNSSTCGVDDILKIAQQFTDWVMSEETKTLNTSNTAKVMHDLAKNPTGIMKPTDHNNNDLPDLPY